jgi:hypothetical protein
MIAASGGFGTSLVVLSYIGSSEFPTNGIQEIGGTVYPMISLGQTVWVFGAEALENDRVGTPHFGGLS